jgi:hypothetical protein
MRFVSITGVNSLTFSGGNCFKQKLKRQPKLYRRIAVGADCELPNSYTSNQQSSPEKVRKLPNAVQVYNNVQVYL